MKTYSIRSRFSARIWSFVLCALMLCAMGNWQGALAASDPNLKLHFNFDEELLDGRVRDLSGNDNHGIQFNPTNRVTITNGVFGSRAAQFTTNFTMGDASGHVYPASQYIAVTNLAGIRYLTNATMSFWVQFDPNYAITIQIMSAGFTAVNAIGGVAVASNSWKIARNYRPYLTFTVFPAVGKGVDIVNWPLDVVRPGGSSPDLRTTNMHLHTLTVDCVNDRAVAYYDGEAFQTNRIGLPWIRVYGHPTPWLCIGADHHVGTPQWGDDLWPNDGYHMGRLDDIRIYNRTLSPDEVRSLYRGSDTVAASTNTTLARPRDDVFELSWSTKSNVFYRLEGSTNAAGGPWTPIAGDRRGDDSRQTFLDTNAVGPRRFYRVFPRP